MIPIWLVYGIHFKEKEPKLPRLIHRVRTDGSLENCTAQRKGLPHTESSKPTEFRFTLMQDDGWL